MAFDTTLRGVGVVANGGVYQLWTLVCSNSMQFLGRHNGAHLQQYY